MFTGNTKLDYSGVIGWTCFSLKPVHGHFSDTVIMYECRHKNEKMKNLVRLKPKVAFSREESFRNPARIHKGPAYVEERHEHEPTQGHLVNRGAPSHHN